MKKLFAILVSATMICAMTPAAFAAEAPADAANVQKVEDLKASSYVTNNNDSSRPQDEGNIYVGVAITDGEVVAEESNWESDASSVTLNNTVEGPGFTAVRVDGDSTVDITGSLTLKDDTDGQIASDFTGTGAAITAYDGAVVTASDVTYESEGFVRAFAIVTNATMTVKNSNIKAMGSDPLLRSWDGYYNSANTSMMISPPWVLGIQGGIRAVNVLGTGSTFVVEDSTIEAGGWGVVSTDGCTNPYLYLYNSELKITPTEEGGMNSGWSILGYDSTAYGSGYGTYIIGGAQEYFYGVTFNGATYASILTGGDGYYAGLKAGETYESKAEDGTVVGTYTAEADVPTTINGVFGFMSHNSGSINVLEGAVVNTENAIALYKSADSTWTFDGAELNAGNGVIFQMIDNDDSSVGGFNPFGTYLTEEAGFPTEAYEDAVAYVFTTDTKVDPSKTYYTSDTTDESGYEVVENPTDEGTVAYYEKATGGNQATVNLKNGEYEGSIFNSTGYYAQAPDALTVNIAEDASLVGDIALTSHIHGVMLGDRNVDDVIEAIEEQNEYHAGVGGYYADTDDIEYVFIDEAGEVTEDKDAAAAIQFTKFSTIEYFLIGQVLNKVNYNGMSTADVYVEGDWTVTGQSLVTYLEIAEGAEVHGVLTELADGSILIESGEELIPAGTYGKAFVYVEAPKAESGGGESEGESAGEAPAGESGEAPAGEAPAAPAEEAAPTEAAPAEEPAAGEGAAADDAGDITPAEGQTDGEYVEYKTQGMDSEITVHIFYEMKDGAPVLTDIVDVDGGFSIKDMVPDLAEFQAALEAAVKQYIR